MSDIVKVRLLASIAGAEMHPAGSIIETTVKEAQSLISHGYAELVEDVEIKTSVAAEKREKAVKRKTRPSKK